MQAKIRATGTQATLAPPARLGFAIAEQPRRLSLHRAIVIPSKRSAARNLLSIDPANAPHVGNANQ
jgi:hypothetical protein